MSERITIDKEMMEICEVVAKRSACLKNQVGSVVVKEGRIISMGYNGVLSGFEHCSLTNLCKRKNIKSGTKYEVGDCQHAELNAILFCAKNGMSTMGAELYVNCSVCRMCAKAIIAAGIKRVIYKEADYDGFELLIVAGVKFEKS